MVYLAQPHQIKILESEQAEAQVTAQVTVKVTQQVKRLLDVCTGELSRADLMKSIGLKDRVSFVRIYLELALEAGYIEMTQPDSPKSQTQKYRLGQKGRAMLGGNKNITQTGIIFVRQMVSQFLNCHKGGPPWPAW